MHIDISSIMLGLLFFPPIWIELEFMDEREQRYVVSREGDTLQDVDMLLGRAQELWDAPLLVDSYRMPDRSLVNDYIVHNVATQGYLERLSDFYPYMALQINKAIKDLRQRYRVWDLIRDTRCEYYYVTVRRKAMKELREILGDKDYYGGKFPHHLPLYYYQEVNYEDYIQR